MDQATIWSRMAERWFEIAQETPNPALKKCYRDKALRYRVLATLTKREAETPAARPPALDADQ